MSDHVDRAAEVIEHVLSRHGEHGTYLDVARALDAAGQLVTEPYSDMHWETAECDDEIEGVRCHNEMPTNLRPRRLVGPWIRPDASRRRDQ